MKNNFEIEENLVWNADDVRQMCINEGWYSCGTNEQYDDMLNMVENYYPNNTMIYFVAKNIYEHSDKGYFENSCNLTPIEAVEHIMYVLRNYVVKTYYDVFES